MGVRYFQIIKQSRVYYSAYTKITTTKNDVHVLHFKAFVMFYHQTAPVCRTTSNSVEILEHNAHLRW